jgi:hypothetical protein
MQFIKTPTHSIRYINKGFSTSLCKDVAETFYPENLVERAIESHFDYKGMVIITETPDNPTVALMREPIDRLLSALAMNNTDVDETIQSLKSGEGWQATHPIFAPQNLESIDKVFRFPEEEEQFCTETGLPYPLAELNQSKNPKPSLTKEQQKFFEEYYATDIKLYQSL